MKTLYCINHQGKEQAFVNALESAGWKRVGEFRSAKICLVDSDVTPLRVKNLENMADVGCKIMIYPHAARVNLFYDFEGIKPFPQTAAQFVVSEGHKRILEAIGYPFPIYPVGWSYCGQLPFKPVEKVKNVLFAPIHANGNGWLSDTDRNINKQAFGLLYAKSIKGQFKLTVRYLRNLEEHGLKQVSGVMYISGRPDQSTSEIDQADLVVSSQTMLYLAVARGKPALGMGENIPPRLGHTPETLKHALHFESYKHILAYPLDILNCLNVDELFETASHCEASTWRENMVGKPFDTRAFLRIVEKECFTV